jgi:hypothetical protein
MSKLRHYILSGHDVIPCIHLMAWADWMQNANRQVAVTICHDGRRVSTVFLGMDHQFMEGGPPLLFETMVFRKDTSIDEICERCSTWEQAERQHLRVVAQVHIEGEEKASEPIKLWGSGNGDSD